MFEFLSKKRILLIEPPFYRLFGYERWHYSVTLVLVGTYLKKLGNDVMVYDADKPSADCRSLSRHETREKYPLYIKGIEDKSLPIWSEIKKTIEDFKPDVIGLTSITAKIDSANIIAQMVKESYGDKIKIMLGGPHVQGMRIMFPDYDFGPNYDYIVADIPNLVEHKPNKSLLMDLEKYSSANLSCLLTSTGCPNSCTFCCNSYNKGFVYRSINSVREEVQEIKKTFTEKRSIYIMDDCLFSNSKHFNEVIQVMKDEEVLFTASSRIMSLSPDKMEKFVDCGGQRVYTGVESGSQRILDLIKKRVDVKEIIKRSKWLNELNIPWTAFCIVGFPFETVEDLKLTEELIYRIKPTFVSLNRFVPYPGTEIYKTHYMDKQILFRDLFQLNKKSVVKLTEENEKYIDHLFQSFDEYNSKNSQNKNLKR